MRKLKFRGVSLSGGLMVVGGGVDMQRDTPIIINQGARYFVDEKTIGQFTGLQDINGTDIYEGDIIHQLDPVSFSPIVVLFDEARSCYNINKEQLMRSTINQLELVVIGNIHENPGLIS